jgi:type IV pilus assembly protein PilV
MRKFPALHPQSGMTLVEVLVALVIFAFGLLGAAGLQLSTLKSNQFSGSSSVAVSLARDYGELMQMYPSAVVSTTAGTSSFFLDTNSFTTTSVTACNGSAAACDAAAMLNAMKSDWAKRVVAALPDGRAEVCRDSAPRDASGNLQWGGCNDTGDLVVIKFGWSAKADKGETSLSNSRPKIVVPVLGNLQDFVTP